MWLNHQGMWKLYLIDDFIPCLRRVSAYSKSSSANEIWVQILEKAYAKMQGNYFNILNRPVE